MIKSIEPSSTSTASPATPRPRPLRRMLRWLAIGLLGLVMLIMLLWSVLMLYYADTHTGPRSIRALVFTVASITVLFIRPRRYGLAAFALLFLVVIGWFFTLKPSNERDWAPEVARVFWSQSDGDRLVVHNVRNFDYRTESEFDQRWEDRTYDLSKLRSGDMMLVYCGERNVRGTIARRNAAVLHARLCCDANRPGWKGAPREIAL